MSVMFFIEFIKLAIRCEACRAFYRVFATSLIISIIPEHNLFDSIYNPTLKFRNYICHMKNVRISQYA